MIRKCVAFPVLLAFALSLAAAVAQVPGQYPGQYPPYPGRYPGDDPSRQPKPGTLPGPGTRSKNKEHFISVTTDGMLRRRTQSQLVLQADDHRIVWYRTNPQTTYTGKDSKAADASTWKPGDHISVESTSDDNGRYTAVSVRFVKDGAATERQEAQATWDMPGVETAWAPPAPDSASSPPRTGDSDDDARPVMRRPGKKPQGDDNSSKGKGAAEAEPEPPEQPGTVLRPPDPTADADDPGRPAMRRGAHAEERPPVQVADTRDGIRATTSVTNPESLTRDTLPEPEKPAPPDPAKPAAAPASPGDPKAWGDDDATIRKTRETIPEYLSSLPNFLCHQFTTRYSTENIRHGWTAYGTVSADIAFEDGHENYRNIQVNNKAAKGDMLSIGGGTTSTGEFASTLNDIFSPASGTEFRRSGSENIAGRESMRYTFRIQRERSHWRVMAPSELYYPAQRGTIWIDKENFLVLRIELQARNMPEAFPFDTVEKAVDYAAIRLGPDRKFLLPVDAEVLSCDRGQSTCTRNRIEFRNYRKFGAESDIQFGGDAKTDAPPSASADTSQPAKKGKKK